MSRASIVDPLTVAVLLFSILMAGCTLAAIPSNPAATETTSLPPGPRLRIKNTGTIDIQDLTVLFPESRIHFGDVPAGAMTGYLPAPNGVYNYAAYEYLLNGKTTSQPVIDWMGESPRPGSSFTYTIDFDPARPEMQAVHLIEVQDQ